MPHNYAFRMSSAPLLIKEDIVQKEILQSARQLYQKHGLRKVTMDDVANAIGRSRSSLYYYYKNRDEIFDAVTQAIIAEIIDEIALAVESADTVKNKIRAFCITKIKTSEERKKFYVALEAGMDADEISRHAKAMNAVHKRLMALERDVLCKILSSGIINGEVRPLKPKERDILIFILLSSVRGIRKEMTQENDFSSVTPAVDTLTAMTVRWLES